MNYQRDYHESLFVQRSGSRWIEDENGRTVEHRNYYNPHSPKKTKKQPPHGR